MGEKKKVMPYDVIIKLMPVLENYYKTFGNALVFIGSDKAGCATQEAHANQEFLCVLKECGAFAFFVNSSDEDTFKSHCGHSYGVLDTVARLSANLCKSLIAKDGKGKDLMLSYTMYVFNEAASVTKLGTGFDSNAYASFNKRAAAKIAGIIGEPVPSARASSSHASTPSRNESEKKASDFEKYMIENMEEIKRLHKEYGAQLLKLTKELEELKNRNYADRNISKQVHKELQELKDRNFADREISRLVQRVKEIESKTEKCIDDKEGKAVKPVWAVLSGLIGLVCPPAGVFMGVANSVTEATGLTDIFQEKTGNLVKSIFGRSGISELFNKSVLKDLDDIIGSPYIPIAQSYLCYRNFKKTKIPSERLLYKELHDYVYGHNNQNKDLSDKVHMLYEVCWLCDIDKLIDWNKLNPMSLGVRNAVFSTLYTEVLRELDCNSAQRDKFIKDIQREYNFAPPTSGVRLSDYWNR